MIELIENITMCVNTIIQLGFKYKMIILRICLNISMKQLQKCIKRLAFIATCDESINRLNDDFYRNKYKSAYNNPS